MKNRLAVTDDILKISRLYYQAYGDHYPDPTIKNPHLLQKSLHNPQIFWFVSEFHGQIIASVVFRYDASNLLAKVYGGVVDDQYRGANLLFKLMRYGMNFLQRYTGGVEVIYATTRTVHQAAQVLTEKLGFRTLGILPNVHKTQEYETHCLSALISDEALAKRFIHYKVHAQVARLVQLVKNELALPPFTTIDPSPPSRSFRAPALLEIISAEQYVNHRFNHLKQQKQLEFMFYPFLLPNYVLVTPDLSVELFVHISQDDGHCAIIAAKLAADICFSQLLLGSCGLLRSRGVRYVELILTAKYPKVLNSVIAAKFIPCAFFPALQLENGQRYDYYLLSRSFEIFDFKNIQLSGTNLKFLQEYYRFWKEMALNPQLLSKVVPRTTGRKEYL